MTLLICTFTPHSFTLGSESISEVVASIFKIKLEMTLSGANGLNGMVTAGGKIRNTDPAV